MAGSFIRFHKTANFLTKVILKEIPGIKELVCCEDEAASYILLSTPSFLQNSQIFRKLRAERQTRTHTYTLGVLMASPLLRYLGKLFKNVGRPYVST
jgi:hypothetical protein